MLRYICFISFLAVILTAVAVAANDASPKTRVVKTVTSSISSESTDNSNSDNGFETAHKINQYLEFHTAHKITNERPIIKLLDDKKSESKSQETASGSDDLMQQQKTENLLSTKERPELNPVLSALINEDVMKSIESKRAIEESIQIEQNEKVAGTNDAGSTVTVPPTVPSDSATPVTVAVLTTTQQPIKTEDSDATNEGLIDRSVNLEVAGSENNQKSRIQIKKGPNGVDYEYEYVYYYYDEDEKNEKGTGKQKVTAGGGTEAGGDLSGAKETTRGKSRYTNIERSTTSAPGNEIIGKGRGRSSAAVADEVEEGRLPQITRFPPRSKGGDITPAPETEISNAKSRRTGVKRPSLELVDSDTFNTDEKQVKGTRNLDSELSKKSEDGTNDGSDSEQGAKSEDSVDSTDTDLDVSNTTPLMEKAALDLYAILANENFNMDATTDSSDDTTTDLPTTDSDDLTTIYEESTSTTTTTTTPEPTTTTTTTTTTTPAPAGRRGLSSGGRNRFRLKSGGTTTTTTEAAPSETKTGGKPKNRFGRPSFGSGRTTRPSNSGKDEAKEEVATKDEAKSSSSSLRGRTRNRFNFRGASTTEKSSADENTVEPKTGSTTARTLRGRPQLNIRGRGRPGATSTTASPDDSGSDSDNGGGSEKVTQATPASARPSRFNLSRPVGGNRLLPRARLNPAKPTAAPAAAAAGNDDAEDGAEKKDTEDSTSEGTITAGEDGAAVAGEEKVPESPSTLAGGLNRLKNRPKIQITPKTAKAPAPVVVRKVNPLLARRRIGGLSSTTTEAAPAEDAEESSDDDDKNVAGDSEDPKDEAASQDTEQIVEASSEQPRGLGLLGNRRRLPARKPGTLL